MPTTSMMRFSWSMSAWLRKCPTAKHGLSPGPQTPDVGSLPGTCSPAAGDSEPKVARSGTEPTPLDPHRAAADPGSPLTCAKDTVISWEEGLSLEQLGHDAAHRPDVHCGRRRLHQSAHPKSLLREPGAGCTAPAQWPCAHAQAQSQQPLLSRHNPGQGEASAQDPPCSAFLKVCL